MLIIQNITFNTYLATYLPTYRLINIYFDNNLIDTKIVVTFLINIYIVYKRTLFIIGKGTKEFGSHDSRHLGS